MRFSSPLIPARLLKRYKRFLADVELESEEVVTAHCANPGSMIGLKTPGTQIWLSRSDNPKRKLKYSWELSEIEGRFIGINTAHPNRLVEEALQEKRIEALKAYDIFRREVKYGANSRIDLLLEHQVLPSVYVEVKNVHLFRESGIAEFPDSVTSRGTKHMGELAAMVHTGHRAVVVFVIQAETVERFKIADDIDPVYFRAFQRALSEGVEALAYSCTINTSGIALAACVPFLDQAPV